MATLATNVHVTDAEGTVHVFGPADDVPAWAQELIINPKAWAEPPVASNDSRSSESKPPAKRAAPRRKAAGGGADQ